MRKAPVEKVKEFRLRFKPEVQARIDARPIVRRLTDSERRAREIERTKDYRTCVCCEFRQPPHLFNSPSIPVCHQCCWRGAVYGRKRGEHNIPEINAAKAVIRKIERVACRMK